MHELPEHLKAKVDAGEVVWSSNKSTALERKCKSEVIAGCYTVTEKFPVSTLERYIELDGTIMLIDNISGARFKKEVNFYARQEGKTQLLKDIKYPQMTAFDNHHSEEATRNHLERSEKNMTSAKEFLQRAEAIINKPNKGFDSILSMINMSFWVYLGFMWIFILAMLAAKLTYYSVVWVITW